MKRYLIWCGNDFPNEEDPKGIYITFPDGKTYGEYPKEKQWINVALDNYRIQFTVSSGKFVYLEHEPTCEEVRRLLSIPSIDSFGHIYCDGCGEIQPMIVDFLPPSDMNDHGAVDLMCSVCRLVNKTLHNMSWTN